jgi:NADH-ubiquinone oxidoreductase chain 2
VIVVMGGLILLVLQTELRITVILFGLAIKLGAAPFHSWLITVAESLAWIPLFTLLTVQKLNPLFIIWSFSQINSNFFHFIVFSSLLVGSLIGLAQTRTRALITFSSISHVGWFLTRIAFSLETGLLYFLIYRVVLLAPVLLLESTNVSHVNQLPLIQIKLHNQCILFFSLLSLGGLPPFLGFLPKWVILQLRITFSFYLLALIIILTSLFTLYFYLRLIFSAFIFGGVKIFQEKRSSASFLLNFLLGLSLGGLSLIYFL